jgi:hypothetical protein
MDVNKERKLFSLLVAVIVFSFVYNGDDNIGGAIILAAIGYIMAFLLSGLLALLKPQKTISTEKSVSKDENIVTKETHITPENLLKDPDISRYYKNKGITDPEEFPMSDMKYFRSRYLKTVKDVKEFIKHINKNPRSEEAEDFFEFGMF